MNILYMWQYEYDDYSVQISPVAYTHLILLALEVLIVS